MFIINALKTIKENPLTFNLTVNDNHLTVDAVYQSDPGESKPSHDPTNIPATDPLPQEFDCGNATTKLESYRSYGLLFGRFIRREKDQTLYRGNIKLVDYCRLGIASRETFMNIPDFWVHTPIGQVDTGLISENDSQIVFTIFGKYNSECEIISDIPIEYNTDLPPTSFQPHGSMPRFKLWDRYAININGVEYQANHNGKYFNQEEILPVIQARDIIEIDIQKYTADFSRRLNRRIDAHEIVLESTCGILRSTRVDLIEGQGKAYLHTLGHLGRFKLKIGLRWYPVWCEYNLQLV